jgi:hypothetical protein
LSFLSSQNESSAVVDATSSALDAAGDGPAIKKAKTDVSHYSTCYHIVPQYDKHFSPQNNESSVTKTPTPTKERTPRKRGISQAERTLKEAQALIGDLKEGSSSEGSRRTRSATRGTPAPSIVEKISPKPRAPSVRKDTPAVKKNPATPSSAGSARGRKGRGRGRPKGGRGRKSASSTSEAGETEEDDKTEGDAVNPPDAQKQDKTDSTDKQDAVVNENGQSSESEEVKEEVKEEASKTTSSPVKESPVSAVVEPVVEQESKQEEKKDVVETPSSETTAPSDPKESTTKEDDDGWN